MLRVSASNRQQRAELLVSSGSDPEAIQNHRWMKVSVAVQPAATNAVKDLEKELDSPENLIRTITNVPKRSS